MTAVTQKKAFEDVSMYRSMSSISSSASTAEATAGNDVSSFLFDDYRDDGFSTNLSCKHWVSVGHLSLTTTDAELKSLFYPYGADEAFTVWEGTTMMGFVGFDSPEMAELAAQKMHDFVPRRQSQALAVRAVRLEEVLRARTKGPISLLAVLYSECATQGISAVIRRSNSPVAVARDVAVEVARASPAVLQRLVAAFSDLSPQWFGFTSFSEELLKSLLGSLLEVDEMNTAQAINCGAVVGILFQMNMIIGDPYYLASRLLQRAGQSLVQLEGICTLAHTCALLPGYHVSRASFWDQVADIAAKVADPVANRALRGYLRRYTQTNAHAAITAIPGSLSSSAPSPLVFSTMPCPSATVGRSQVVRQRTPPQYPCQDQMRCRTIYISHLPGLLPQSMLLELLTAAGPVNKVRICTGAGYSTLFAFVEMRTAEGAHRAMCMNGLQLMGYTIRVETARNAVQDVIEKDAQFDANGAVIQPCLFGMSQAPLSKCLTSTD
ncbi:conserved hypothetical protein [Leishmania braziliensis MHOM/BR/75/M2904]|uniref:RRM domain-containing protein n=2 Tax=Leishmania braziliensis TaxID=5660 RepID=A4HFG0_LEIBR|nr:conserved hypothetical protein [Leishmania braziliensis MHOM/BR/75/M2904]KAI5684594.1 RNA recognition motif [Leishmania braziliensis]CAJ2475078.1 unnamed protein product [Leishmania braziliensis]CAJ2475584.1 unnamed protein product [Leishmania braziliensis]CAM45321.1 conserved hypothetical protein [Leishmania braziliensis MHOM/BR/75/M2904]SYZ66966.1 RNA_recognition_motif._(a.k.a._RRM [Leishmania braziliensis MHOM/BR/75/M2904]